MEIIVLFFTHSGAIKFKRRMEKLGLELELMPVPRKLSSNCSIAARLETDLELEDLIDREIEEIYQIKGEDYILLYKEGA